MTFTDDDLKRLKEICEGDRVSHPMHNIGKGKLEALLARLEAAESLLEDINYDVFSCDDGLLEGWKAWRKAAGK